MHSLFPDAVGIGSLFDDPQGQVLPVLSPNTPTSCWSSMSSDSESFVNPMLFTATLSDHGDSLPTSTIFPASKVCKPTRHHSHTTDTAPTSRRTINHRSAERRRRQSIKEGMHRLGEVLASAAARCDSLQAAHLRGFAGGRRPSKVQMLDAGIEHILVLQQAVVQLAKDNEQMRRQSC